MQLNSQLSLMRRQAMLRDRMVCININNRCPLRCRHCSVGFSTEFRGTDKRIGVQDLTQAIAGIDQRVYPKVAFAGGEPSLEPDLLREGIAACKKNGLLSVICTAPIWGANPSAAERFLDSVDGLNQVIISYDQYHLEFLSLAHYENAVEAAARRGITIAFLITYAESSETPELLKKIAGMQHKIAVVGTVQIVPVGNAADIENMKIERISIREPGDLAKLPRGCILGTAFIDEAGAVHGCCYSCTVSHSPFTKVNQFGGAPLALKQIEESAVFQGFLPRGFIDGLTPKGQEALARLANGRQFANECHLCKTAMQEGKNEIWEEYIKT